MYPAVHARSNPDKAAIIIGCGDVVSYRQLNERSNQCAHLFASLGLGKDDAVALFMGNCPDYFYATWAAQRSGLYYTPISTHLSAAETAYIVENCAATVLLVSYALRLIEHHRVTFSQWVPTMFIRMLKLPQAVRGSYDVAVIGVPNEDLGEEVKAVVEPIDFATSGPQLERELIAWCRVRLSHIKCPKSIDFERNLPRSDVGKLFKRRIRERYWQGRESSII